MAYKNTNRKVTVKGANIRSGVRPRPTRAPSAPANQGPGVRNRGRNLDSIVDEAVRGGAERQSRY